MSSSLYLANHPARFWQLKLTPEPAESSWEEAARAAAPVLPERFT